MTQSSPTPFLDVQSLLQRSLPVRRNNLLWYALVSFGVLVLVSSASRPQSAGGSGFVELFSSLLMLALIAGMMFISYHAARSVGREQQRLESIEELIQLRRWPEAASMLEHLLSTPTHTPQTRFQGLLFLAVVLGRYHRFHDAIEIYEYLLKIDQLDPAAAHGLKLGRAMSLLRDDRLWDADRAIVDMRREGSGVSAGLELVELYRDVKTGHPQEACERFDKQLPLLKKGLGFRVADAWALAAAATLACGDPDAAQRHWTTATTLVPPLELIRRYPELSTVADACQPCPVPTEAK